MVRLIVVIAVLALLSSCGFKRKKYENPIAKDTQQPDKVLYDKAVNDIEHGRYEVARITLNTLMNTYDTSEFMAKAKLAIADSWYREGGAHGLAQAEAEYKDFILFYPTMEESAESQYKICQIHYKQMEKPDRDASQALRAEAECRQLLVQFPNSKYAPGAEQTLRNIQEVLAESEMRVGQFYHGKGSHPAAANRLSGLVDQYPLYSGSDEALWLEADSYSRMGPKFRNKAGEAYARLLRDYPLSGYADAAKNKLKEMEMPIPEADPVALNRMKYEEENRTHQSLVRRTLDPFLHGPDTHMAAKSGTPTMNQPRALVPASVPVPAGAPGFQGEVTATTVTDSTALDTKPDARQNPPAQSGGASAAPAQGGEAAAAPAQGGEAAAAPAQGGAATPVPAQGGAATPVPAQGGAAAAAPAQGGAAASATPAQAGTQTDPLPRNGQMGKPKKQKKPKKKPEAAPAEQQQPAQASTQPSPSPNQ
jgi:outer membrane protein assembly factor BamD